MMHLAETFWQTASNQLYLNKVQTTITRYEGSDLLAVLDELDTHTLSDGRVWLLSLYSPARTKLTIARILVTCR